MNPVPILMVDDDEDDCLLTKEALEESRLENPIYFVHNGIALMNYLEGKDIYADRDQYPLPGLILLDLNMPRLDGRGALKRIKKNPAFSRIPVIVMTTSREEADVLATYDLGASSFITKPITFNDMIKTIQTIGDYWFAIVRLP